ncbi:HupE/UreJ family protein [Polaromonas sp. CG_9.11]|uniref:HupE/UreJ family protein n=1 Tax=Polaromonas sp. CG_9.11 TaxID=2787730 RepID=UPI0018CACF66|nr:HupE/UreJ family protein [Polaromonas sp. CG_9.11]
MSCKPLRTIFLIAISALSTSAMAHIGTDSGAHAEIGFAEGLQHPFTGLDHVAAMLAMGFWSALSARRLWTVPLAFATMLLAGALLGLAGIELPAVEPMIAASLLVLGLLVALRTRLPAALAASLVGLFAIFHGVAHGTELTGAANLWAPLSGMLLATLALHAIGLGLGLAFRDTTWISRLAGTSVAALGVTLLAQLT